MSDDNNVIDFATRVEFPKAQQPPIEGMSMGDVNTLCSIALARMNGPVLGCLMVFWDANGVMSVSDNRGHCYTAEQLQWMTFGMAHLKGRGIPQPVPTGGAVTPLDPRDPNMPAGA